MYYSIVWLVMSECLHVCREEELVRLTAQEFFGERALITNEVRKANVVACGPVECLV